MKLNHHQLNDYFYAVKYMLFCVIYSSNGQYNENDVTSDLQPQTYLFMTTEVTNYNTGLIYSNV